MEKKTYTEQQLDRTAKAISNGADVTDAINKNCGTNEAYNAALKKYGLKPHVHD